LQSLRERIDHRHVLLSDGAMGTMLFKQGVGPGDCPEAVALERPEVLTEIARAYLDAGSDMVQTNTFGGSPAKLAHYGLAEQTEAINRAAVEAARAAVGDRAHVLASVGPSGQILKPYGDADPEQLRAGFVRQIKALVEAGADGVVVETMTDIEEACLAVSAAREVSTELPLLATMTFDSTPRGFFTIMGVKVQTACTRLKEAGADLLGANCGNGIDKMVELACAFSNHSELPLVIQSNAGLPELVNGEPTYSESPDFMAARVPRLLAAGVNVIGGCCGTTPYHITALRKAIDQARPR
jgi:5-methyltetrahydrofolate--homocysteine methyltransferase